MDAVTAFNPTFKAAMDQLLAIWETEEPPEVCRQFIIPVLQQTTKLFCWVGNAQTADGVRATGVEAGFYASDLLVKLLSASIALDWEVVAILLEQAMPPEALVPTAESPR
jgi:hypothetical protein